MTHAQPNQSKNPWLVHNIKVTLDEAWLQGNRLEGICPRQHLALIHPSATFFGLQLPQSLDLTSPWMPVSKETTLVVNLNRYQRFIGVSNFYWKFIHHFSTATKPLHNLTKADTQFVCTKKCNKAFESLKTFFRYALILMIGDS